MLLCGEFVYFLFQWMIVFNTMYLVQFTHVKLVFNNLMWFFFMLLQNFWGNPMLFFFFLISIHLFGGNSKDLFLKFFFQNLAQIIFYFCDWNGNELLGFIDNEELCTFKVYRICNYLCQWKFEIKLTGNWNKYVSST
jgi:hypothetical protein